MIRRRPNNPGDGGSEDGGSSGLLFSPASGNGKNKALYHNPHAAGSAAADGSEQQQQQQQQPKPIVPHWLVCLIVLGFLAAGFGQEHWARSRDPMRSHPNAVRHHQQQQQPPKSKNIQWTSLLTPEQDSELERDPATGLRYHLVFSTDCSAYQHWQSYLVYYTAMKVRQPGTVTRIASGCDDDAADAMQQWFDQDIQPLSKRFHLQLTPHFSDIKDSSGKTVGDYKFFNKPFGLKYWMEHSPQLNFHADTGEFDDDLHTDVVILIDPDMGLLRPITADFSNDRESLIAKPRQGDKILARKVGPGHPFAQVYGFGTQWQKLDLEKIAGPDTPAAKVSAQDGRLYYPVGPPYLGTVPDMHQIAVAWSSFVPATYEQYPHLLAEMFAYCIAAAHLQLPHQLMDSLMISAVGVGGEGWPLVDAIPHDKVCGFAKNIQHDQYAVPSVVHLCQRYAVGTDWFFSKRRVPADVYDCNVPLFAEPPDDLAVQYNFKQPAGLASNKRTNLSPQAAGQESFMICYLHAIVNEAATFYKKHVCSPDEINLEKTRSLAELLREENHKR